MQLAFLSIGRVSRYGVNILAIELFEDYKTTKPQVRLYSFPSSLHYFITSLLHYYNLKPQIADGKNPCKSSRYVELNFLC